MDSFHAYVDAHAGEFVDELMTLCRQPSIAAQHVGMEKMAFLVARVLQELNAEVRLDRFDDGPPIVYAELGEGPKTLVIYNHYDVQPPEPLDLWESPPFEPEIRDGKIFARGVADNKGNLMARVQAIRAWATTNGRLPIRIKWIIEGEEEVGSGHLPEWIESNRDALIGADGCLWESSYKDLAGRQIINLGVKGILYVELRSYGASRDLHSSMAAIVPNPAWRLTQALNELVDTNGRILIRDYMDHVAPPSEAALALLERMPFDEEATKADWQITNFVGGLSGLELKKKLLYEPTCTICGLDAGYTGQGSKTVLPHVAMAKLDFRLTPNLVPELALDMLRRHLDERGFDDIEIIVHGMTPPAQTDPSAPIVRTAAEALGLVCREGVVVRPTTAGSGPMHLVTERLGIPTVSFGVGHVNSNQHAPNENIYIDDYIEGLRGVGEFIRLFAESG